MPNSKFSIVVKLVAKQGKEEEVARFLAGALPLAQSETYTQVWFALRTGPRVFYIVDSFADDAGRTQHLNGPIAAALMAKATELFAEPPQIEKADVLAAKIPG
jgi:quinol monooxygenase YgiN